MLAFNEGCEEKYRDLINAVNSIIIRFDTKGNFTFLNEFAQKFFGYSEAELLGKNVMGTIVPPSDSFGKDLKLMIDDLLVTPQKYVNNENENITRDGRHVWISWTNKPILGEDGKVKEVLSVGNDISLLKRTQVELEMAKELAEAAGRVGTIVCSGGWKVRAINSAACKYFYLEEKEAEQKDICEIIFRHYEPSIPKAQICDVFTPRLSFDLVRPEDNTNKALYLQVNREVLRTENQVVSIIFSIQDVTEQRKEEFLKQDFLGLISHKLRTPLTAITQCAGMLQEGMCGQLGEKQKSFVDSIAEESLKLNGLISNLLNFITFNNHNITALKEPIKLAGFLPGVIKPFLTVNRDKPVEIELDCPDQELTLNMDSSHLSLVVGNLIDNAIKFNDKNAVAIKISAKKEGKTVLISISDNGPGIPVEEQDRIFAGFYQPEKHFTGNVAGAGLGLLLVKKIVTANGGTIDLKSEIGQGSTVTLSLTSPDK